jgi:glycosyltransferase involved in cell wall biosynthesis
LVVVDSFCVERGPGASGASAEEDESSASTDVVNALFPDFDLAGAFDDDVIAEAFGLEVIDVDGFSSELFADGEAGWVCEPTAESLAAAIVSMYEPNRLHHIQNSLKELKKQFSWPSMVRALESVTR